jgi:hypothetical protein
VRACRLGQQRPAAPPEPEAQPADRGQSAWKGTWRDRTSKPATLASALPLLHPGSSAERCRLPSQSLRGYGRCVRPKDARDKEPRALRRPQSCGCLRAELYNTKRPNNAIGNQVRARLHRSTDNSGQAGAGVCATVPVVWTASGEG